MSKEGEESLGGGGVEGSMVEIKTWKLPVWYEKSSIYTTKGG